MSAAMVVALLTGGGVASIDAVAADLPVNITCPQVNACSELAAGFGFTHGVAVDSSGFIYVTSTTGVLWTVSADGVKTQVASGLGNLNGVTVADDDSVYVVNEAGVLWKFSSGGVQTELANGFGAATDVATDGVGNAYVISKAGVLWKVLPDGTKTEVASGLTNTECWGLALDSDGNAYVTNVDGNNGALVKVSPAGVKSQVATGLGVARGVALDAAGNAYVGNNAGLLWRVYPNGVKETVATSIGSGSNAAFAVAMDTQGNAFVGSNTGMDLWSLPGVGVPVGQPPAAPLVSAPQEGATTGAFPKFKGKAVGEGGTVDADEVKILDANGTVLQTVGVRQTDGYFSWLRNEAWSSGEHTVRFVAMRGGLESEATAVNFEVAPVPTTPVVTVPAEGAQTGPTPKFIGSAPGASQVLVQDTDNTTIGQVSVRSDGYFSWKQAMPWAIGSHTVRFVAKNAQGSSAPKDVTFSVDVPAPVLTLPAPNSTTGTRPKFVGTAPARSTVEFYENDVKLGSARVSSGGNWSWRLTDEMGTRLNWTPGVHHVDVYTRLGGVQSPEHTTATFTCG
ncbi:hypothetical protein ACWF95_39920 [Streptomyces vinaceus]